MAVITRSMKKNALKNAAPQGPEKVQERGPAEESNTVVNEDAVQGINEDYASANGRDTETDEAFKTNISKESAPNGTPLARRSRKGARRTIKKPKQSTKPRSRVQATSSKGGPDKENSSLDTSSGELPSIIPLTYNVLTSFTEISPSTRIPKGVRLVPRGARPETGTVVPPKRGREETNESEDLETTRTDGRRVRQKAENTPAPTRTLRSTTNALSRAKGNDCLYCLPALLEVTSRLWEQEENADGARTMLTLSIPIDFRGREEELERDFKEAEFRYRVRRATPYIFEESNLRNLSVDSDEED